MAPQKQNASYELIETGADYGAVEPASTDAADEETFSVAAKRVPVRRAHGQARHPGRQRLDLPPGAGGGGAGRGAPRRGGVVILSVVAAVRRTLR